MNDDSEAISNTIRQSLPGVLIKMTQPPNLVAGSSYLHLHNLTGKLKPDNLLLKKTPLPISIRRYKEDPIHRDPSKRVLKGTFPR